MIQISLTGNAHAEEIDFNGEQFIETWGPYQVSLFCSDCTWKVRNDRKGFYECCPDCGCEQIDKRIGRWRYRLEKNKTKRDRYFSELGELIVRTLYFLAKADEANNASQGND